MMSDSNTLQSLWKHLEERRGDRHLDARDLMIEVVSGKIPGPLNLSIVETILQQAASGEIGEFLSPKMASHFMAELARIAQPDSILDPVCGVGLMLNQVINTHTPRVAKGIEIDAKTHEIADALLKEHAVIVRGNALDIMSQQQDAYDLIIADPPLGLHVPPKALPQSLKTHGLRDLGQNIALLSCERINPNGQIAVATTSATLRHQPFIDAIHNIGFRIRAALHIPSRSRLNTMTHSLVLVIDNSPQRDIFVGQLSDDPEHMKRLMLNFKRHKSDKHPTLGRTVSLETYISFEALEADHILKQRTRKTSLIGTPFLDLVKEEHKREHEPPENNSKRSADNSILVTRSGIYLATDSFSISPRDKNIMCFALDESQINATYFVRWLESELGKLALQAAGATNLIGMTHISRHALNRLICYIPSLEVQHNIIETQRQLERLRNEINEIEALCWTEEGSSDQILQRIKTINHEDRYEDWLATLPYPLASILWRHRVSGDDPRIRYSVLLHFFEALAEFLATLHLSAFQNHTDIWSECHPELLNILREQNLSLERASFGTWKVVVEKLGKTARGMLSQQDLVSVVTSMYSVTGTLWLSKLCASEINQILSSANAIRNTTSGHGGAMGKQQAQSIEDNLLDMVEKIRSLWGRSWGQYELLLIEKMTFEDGQFIFEAPCIMGANSQFERVSRRTTNPMATGQLYLLAEGAPKGLCLLPLIRVMPSPSQVANACYFYNRSEQGGQRFVSYHFENEADVCEHFEDTALALQKLSSPQLQPIINGDA